MANLISEFEEGIGLESEIDLLNGSFTDKAKKVALHTLGCKLNFSETSTIGQKFVENGFKITDFEKVADYYVINTCSVTDHADKKTKKIVKDALSLNPDANIIIIGCYAQLKPKEISEIPGVNLVLGAAEKFNIIEHLSLIERDKEAKILNSHIKEVLDFKPSFSSNERTRSFLKVQDGCDYFCAFCTIPLARGRSRSSNINDVLGQVKIIADKGFKEIVLTGVNTGDFKNEKGENFLSLIQALDTVSYIERFRISSIEPNLFTDECIDFVSISNKFVPHFHIPLQSGSDKMLELMRRRYNSSLYLSRVEKIKSLMPNACIGVDVIVGFPSETEEDFMETFHFLESLPISYLHVFTYSERPNTTALRIQGKIPNRIRSERNAILTELSNKKRRIFYESQLGSERTVLWETENHQGFLHGFTENYVKVKKAFNPSLINQLEKVKLVEIDLDGLVTCSFSN